MVFLTIDVDSSLMGVADDSTDVLAIATFASSFNFPKFFTNFELSGTASKE